MKISDIIRLLSLAAIWGGSFIFLKVLVPVLGPVTTACLRILIAGIVLSIYYKIINFDVEWKAHWKHYTIIGLVNSAIPFLLYAFAAVYIPASLSIILNSSTPLFGAVFAALWLNDRLTSKKILGLFLGILGVALVAIKGALSVGEFGLWAALACLGAAMCYALAATYIKKFAPFLKPMGIAGASQFIGGLVLLPFALFTSIQGEVDLKIILNMLALAIVCSGIAFVLYYRLVTDVGPAKALTVTFLIPIFGLIWGAIFLHEVITAQMLLGCALIVGGTTLISKGK